MGWDARNHDDDQGSPRSARCLDESWILRMAFSELGSLEQRCADLAGRDVDAAWLGRIADLAQALPLLDANSTTGLGSALLAAAAAPRLTLDGLVPDPDADTSSAGQRAAAQGLVQLVGQLDRVIAWAGAQQAAAMAALGRPGVAVPVADLLDAVTHGGSGGPLGVDSADTLRSTDFQAHTWQDVSVADDPAWGEAAQEQAQRIAAAEVGARLAWTPATARARMFEATDIVDALPLAHRLWAQGHLDRARVVALADRTQDLDPAARSLVEEQLLADDGARLRSKTVPRVRVLVDRCAAALDPDAIRRRQERARQDRDVYITPREDGMSRFCADVSTPVAVLARSVIDHVAQRLPSDRTIGQRRADVFADLFTRLAAVGHVDLRSGAPTDADEPNDSSSLDEQPYTTTGDATVLAAQEPPAVELEVPLPPDWERIDSGVTVIIDATTLTDVDLTSVPAIEGALLGSHPALPVDLVHALAVSAIRARIAIRGAAVGTSDCRYGCATTATNLTIGADIHRPSAKLAEQIVLRDRVCRFPGCRHPARTCDLDHRRPFREGGPTTAENLDALCRFHHRLKTFTRWRAIREPGNRLTWTTPLGAVVPDDPPPF